MPPARKIAFVLASTDHGSLIVNRMDYHSVASTAYGVGHEILETGSFSASEVNLALQLLELRRKYFGDGVVALDCGANIGVHTVEWARRMSGWGEIIAFEAQERIYYALAGNIAINNAHNARAIHCALAAKTGRMKIPKPNYLLPASFGSLELRKKQNTEFIGQPISYSSNDLVEVTSLSIDEMQLDRVDLIKIDVEGMELEVLDGSRECISRKSPLLLVEAIKVDPSQLKNWLTEAGYVMTQVGLNLLAIHKSDPCLGHLKGAPRPATDEG
jgi:FkbM family methyltransferase